MLIDILIKLLKLEEGLDGVGGIANQIWDCTYVCRTGVGTD